jgi:hypothetical protein
MSGGPILVTVRIEHDDQLSTLVNAYERLVRIRPDCCYEESGDFARLTFDRGDAISIMTTVWSAISRCQSMLAFEPADSAVNHFLIQRHQLTVAESSLQSDRVDHPSRG